MPFCSHCGQQLSDDMLFCPHCGTPAASNVAAADDLVPAQTQEVATPVTSTPVAETVPAYQPAYSYAAPTREVSLIYSIVLVSLGSADYSTAVELLEDTLGYETSDARELASSVPVEIATGLNEQQARCIAQALTEYGMQVAVYDGTGYVDLTEGATRSVFRQDGNFYADVLKVLATLTVANRILHPRRWGFGDPGRYIFAPRYYRPMRPVHRRRSFLHPEPRPRFEERRPMQRSHPMGGGFDGPRGGNRGNMGGGPRGGSHGGMGGGPGGGMNGGNRGGMGGGPGGRR